MDATTTTPIKTPMRSPSVALCGVSPVVGGVSSLPHDGVAEVVAGSAELLADFVNEVGIRAAAVRHVVDTSSGAEAPGAIVVAEEVVAAGWVAKCPTAPILAGELRRRGVRNVLARVVTSEIISSPGDDERPVVTVDPEAAELFRAAEQSAEAVAFIGELGSQNDTAGFPLEAELRAAVRSWGSAVGSRSVQLAAPRSFCAGVERAIEAVKRTLAEYGRPLYVRKQIVHNVHVVRDLERQGVTFVDELDDVPVNSTVVFSAHGVSPAVQQQADARGLTVIDATCPLVTKVHGEARRFAQRGDTVVLIGHSGHEESEGTLGEAPDQIVLIENEDDVQRLEIDGPVSYLTQTTLAVDETDGIITALRARFPHLTGPSKDDICYATTNRQYAVQLVAADADLVLVVGSGNSSNSLRLVEVARRNGAQAHLIDDVTDVDPAWLAGVRTVGLTAGASAPPDLVTDVVDALRGYGEVDVVDRQVAEENIQFGLPRRIGRQSTETSGDETATQV